MKNYLLPLLTGWALLLSGSGCVSLHRSLPHAVAGSAAGQPAHLALFDSVRNRAVPVVLYWPTTAGRVRLALLSHGYGGQNTDYSFLARQLAGQGYLVASIQHELPADEPIATTGNLRETRRPNWERGVQNMLFVRQYLQRTYPRLDTRHLLLLGHSNGGDMAALFAYAYPRLVDRLVTLDNRRMPLPLVRRPRMLTLRSSDQPADPGVVPDAAAQRTLGITVVQLANTLHHDMWDGASAAQQQEMSAALANFLRR